MNRMFLAYLAGVFLALNSIYGASAETLSLGGRMYHFDIPLGYEREKDNWHEEFKPYISKTTTTGVVFMTANTSMKESNERSKKRDGQDGHFLTLSEYLSNGLVYRHVVTDIKTTDFVMGTVRTESCAGQCFISIFVIVGTDKNKAIKPSEGKALFEKYTKVLVDRSFEGAGTH